MDKDEIQIKEENGNEEEEEKKRRNKRYKEQIHLIEINQTDR